MIPRALTIAGSDSGGGAGIQADLKTWMSLRVFGMSAITAVTAQNTQTVTGIYPISPAGIAAQIDAVVDDLGVHALKTGMLGGAEAIEVVSERIRAHRLINVVVDPVMIAKSGAKLLQDDARDALIRYLVPLADVVTPNIPEAEVLTGMTIRTEADMEAAAMFLVKEMGCRNAIVKGGHLEGDPVDKWYDGRKVLSLRNQRFETRHTHGTGCTFSAAITAGLAKKLPMNEVIPMAKAYISAAIREELGIGIGHGPTNHWAYADEMSEQLTGAEYLAQVKENGEHQ